MIFWTYKSVKKRPQAPKPIFWVWDLKNLKIRFQKMKNVKKMEPVLLRILCRLDYTLLQTSSRESKIMKNRFGWEFKNTVKMQSESKWVSNFHN